MRTSTGNLVGACLVAALLAACGNNGLSSSTATSVAPKIAAPQSVVDSTVAFGATSSKSTIYVANLGGDKVTAYNPKGKLTLTITADINGPFGVRVDKTGKIYVANTFPNDFTGNVTTYTPDGKQTTPTITAGIDFPLDVLVNKSGKIYVSNLEGPLSSGYVDRPLSFPTYSGNGSVTTYKSDGTQTTPTITASIAGPVGLAVDASGKIYVVNLYNNTVTTYNPDGTQTTPTITTGLDNPRGIAVDANGKIYVANYLGGPSNAGSVTTYTPDGKQTTPTITAGIVKAQGVAVDANGKIYVTNYQGPGSKGGFGSVTTYTANGTRTTPTISKGIVVPALVTLR